MNLFSKVRKSMEEILKKQMIEKERGITLIALIITIIVLLILAGVSIAMLTGENGILNRAEEVSYVESQAKLTEVVGLSIAESLMYMENEHTIDEVISTAKDNGYITDEEYSIEKTTNDAGFTTAATITDKSTNASVILTQTEKNGEITVVGGEVADSDSDSGELGFSVPSTKEEIEILTEETTIKESDGNEVVVPGGFGISNESGINITEGIVIEDSKGNQFVWIPVGDDLVKTNLDGSKTTASIKLGRYDNYEAGADPVSLEYEILGYWFEETQENTKNLGNAIAGDIEEFIAETERNGGFYFGRYENKALSEGKVTINAASSQLVNQTQPQAAETAANMYSDSSFVDSELQNSVAWETAIIYIQTFSTRTEAPSYSGSVGTSVANNDEYCKITNMCAGVYEWCTETASISTGPCTYRGSQDQTSLYTRTRRGTLPTETHSWYGSRTILISIN